MMVDEAKLLAIIKKLDADAEVLFQKYVIGVDLANKEIGMRKKGLDMKLSRSDQNSIKAIQNALSEVVGVRDSYIRSRERHKYKGLEELLAIVNDWFDFISIVTPIHIKSAELLARNEKSVREFSFEERDQLIKIEEIRKRFQERLK